MAINRQERIPEFVDEIRWCLATPLRVDDNRRIDQPRLPMFERLAGQDLQQVVAEVSVQNDGRSAAE